MLPLSEYVRMKPDGVEEKDIFVCESRYSTKSRFFKKIKVRAVCAMEYISWVIFTAFLDQTKFLEQN